MYNQAGECSLSIIHGFLPPAPCYPPASSSPRHPRSPRLHPQETQPSSPPQTFLSCSPQLQLWDVYSPRLSFDEVGSRFVLDRFAHALTRTGEQLLCAGGNVGAAIRSSNRRAVFEMNCGHCDSCEGGLWVEGFVSRETENCSVEVYREVYSSHSSRTMTLALQKIGFGSL
jgi:hypothetical protein